MREENRWTRRRFLGTSALIAAAASLPRGSLSAQPTYTRYNLASPEGQQMLASYQTAIRKLLALPPSDPLNWYRLTLTHTLDCPHGNWWFLPWHRGYIGYFEQIIRQQSNDPSFALPYWDWTTQPEVPAAFFGPDNPLDPTSSLFIQTFAEFKAEFEAPVAELYAGFTAGQNQELVDRELSTPAELWASIDPANGGYFFDGASARCLSVTQPSFATPPLECTGGCAGTPQAVSLPTIEAALEPTDFILFGSGIVDQHSQSGEQGVLENQPHNLVHNCVGGFMSEFMSPVDPIFFMHHSNIERLWLAWTQKQQDLGLPTLPTGDDLAQWEAEPFLFYVDASGQTLSKVAGDFATVGSFDYTYTPGSGSVLSPPPKVAKQNFGDVSKVPARLIRAALKEDGPELFARVQVDPQGRRKGKSFHVLINPPEGLDPTDTSSPHHVATLAFFGAGHGQGHGPTTFVVPIRQALRRLKSAGKLGKRKNLRFFVATEDKQKRAKIKAMPVKAAVTTH